MDQTIYLPLMNTDMLAAFMAAVLDSGVRAVLEHISTPISRRSTLTKASLSHAGFEVLDANTERAFLIHGKICLELSQPEVPMHYAWLVETKEDYDDLLRAVARQKDFELLEDHTVKSKGTKATIFKHSSGEHLQVVWREVALRPGLFASEATEAVG